MTYLASHRASHLANHVANHSSPIRPAGGRAPCLHHRTAESGNRGGALLSQDAGAAEGVRSAAPPPQQRAALASQQSTEPLEVVPLAALARFNMAADDDEGAVQLGHPLRSLRGSLEVAGAVANGTGDAMHAAEALNQEQGGYQEPDVNGNFR
jgi:hypothetical protein